MDHRVIVFSEDDPFTGYPDKQVIQITKRATTALDTREGILRTLPKWGVKATNYQVGYLRNEMAEAEFWTEIKAALVLKRFPTVPRAESTNGKRPATALDLFDKLF